MMKIKVNGGNIIECEADCKLAEARIEVWRWASSFLNKYPDIDKVKIERS